MSKPDAAIPTPRPVAAARRKAAGAAPARRGRPPKAQAKAAGKTLDGAAYAELSKQSTNVTPFTFAGVEDGLFQRVSTLALPLGPGPENEPSPGTNRRAGAHAHPPGHAEK